MQSLPFCPAPMTVHAVTLFDHSYRLLYGLIHFIGGTE